MLKAADPALTAVVGRRDIDVDSLGVEGIAAKGM